jgi:glutathione S-transferase
MDWLPRAGPNLRVCNHDSRVSWIADQAPKLTPKGSLSRYRLLETLAYISTEIHKSFKPFFASDADDKAKAAADQAIIKRLTFLTERLKDDYLLGPEFTVADAYLFVMLMGPRRMAFPFPTNCPHILIESRPGPRYDDRWRRRNLRKLERGREPRLCMP